MEPDEQARFAAILRSLRSRARVLQWASGLTLLTAITVLGLGIQVTIGEALTDANADQDYNAKVASLSVQIQASNDKITALRSAFEATRQFTADAAAQASPVKRIVDFPQLLGISFAPDNLHGWVVGAGGRILATTDGGLHWEAQSSATTERLNSVQVTTDSTHAVITHPLAMDSNL